jgi:hypothetical protein
MLRAGTEGLSALLKISGGQECWVLVRGWV